MTNPNGGPPLESTPLSSHQEPERHPSNQVKAASGPVFMPGQDRHPNGNRDRGGGVEDENRLPSKRLRKSSSQKRPDGPGEADGCGYHAEDRPPRLCTIGSSGKRHPQAGDRRTPNRLDNPCRQQQRKSRRQRGQEGAG